MQRRERELSNESNKGISHLTWALEDNKYMEIKTQNNTLEGRVCSGGRRFKPGFYYLLG